MLECSWDELWNKVHRAQDLDHIIAAHDVFLDTIISRCLLDNNSRVTAPSGCLTFLPVRRNPNRLFSVQSLLNQLRAIFDQIIEFQSAQDALYRSALEELGLRLQFEEKKAEREAEVRTERALIGAEVWRCPI